MHFNNLYQASQQLIARFHQRDRGPEKIARDSPITDDLEIAFSQVLEELSLGAQVVFRMIIEGKSRALDPLIRTEACRIGREALLNAFRHSGASQVEVELEYDPRRLRIAVRDNGKGITPELLCSGSNGHTGLTGMGDMAERMGGKLKLLSRAAAGTEVELSIPAHIAFAPQTSGRRLECAPV
jgi:signal transduction histidine kinase